MHKMNKISQKHFTLMLDTDSKQFLKELSTCMKNNENVKVHNLLTIMEKKPETLYCVKSYRDVEDASETLLHIAVKYVKYTDERYKTEDDKDTIIGRLIDICSDLLSLARKRLIIKAKHHFIWP